MLTNISANPDALEAVEGATKSRWWNSDEVKSLAEQAAESIRERMRHYE